MSKIASDIRIIQERLAAEATELKNSAKKIKSNHKIAQIHDAAFWVGVVAGTTVTAYVMVKKMSKTENPAE